LTCTRPSWAALSRVVLVSIPTLKGEPVNVGCLSFGPFIKQGLVSGVVHSYLHGWCSLASGAFCRSRYNFAQFLSLSLLSVGSQHALGVNSFLLLPIASAYNTFQKSATSQLRSWHLLTCLISSPWHVPQQWVPWNASSNHQVPCIETRLDASAFVPRNSTCRAEHGR
jgi:hypothetical protein